jgi:hypothetical protein
MSASSKAKNFIERTLEASDVEIKLDNITWLSSS